MARTVPAAFEELRQKLEITDLQASKVSTRQQSVREAVERDFTVLTSFLTGSYAKKTLIAPLADTDIDIFIVLDSSYHKADNQASLLDRIRSTILKTFPNTPKISRNGQAVTITFSDFRVDVVPSFFRKGGGYLIPDSLRNEWINTNPAAHQNFLTTANRMHQGKLVPLIKMLKAWNRVIEGAFVGFYLELLAVRILDGVTISDYPSGMRYLFDKGRESVKYAAVDPAGLGGYIQGLANTESVEGAVKRFETAYHRALVAEEQNRRGKPEQAISEWGKIFDGYFPRYG